MDESLTSGNNILSRDGMTQSLSPQRFDRRDPVEVFYIPLDCPNVKKCSNSYCIFSHTKLETIFHPIIYRTKACQKFRNGSCEYENRCTFYHNSTERENAELAWATWEQKWSGWRDKIPDKIRKEYSAVEGLLTKLESIMKIHKTSIPPPLIVREKVNSTPMRIVSPSTTASSPLQYPSTPLSLSSPSLSYDSWLTLQRVLDPLIENTSSKINKFIPLKSCDDYFSNEATILTSTQYPNIPHSDFALNSENNRNTQDLRTFIDSEMPTDNNFLNNSIYKLNQNVYQDILDQKENLTREFKERSLNPESNFDTFFNFIDSHNTQSKKVLLDPYKNSASTTPVPSLVNSFSKPYSNLNSLPIHFNIDNFCPSTSNVTPSDTCILPQHPSFCPCQTYKEMLNTINSIFHALNVHTINCPHCQYDNSGPKEKSSNFIDSSQSNFSTEGHIYNDLTKYKYDTDVNSILKIQTLETNTISPSTEYYNTISAGPKFKTLIDYNATTYPNKPKDLSHTEDVLLQVSAFYPNGQLDL